MKQQYDSYKDSGVEWIGRVPSHWKTVGIKLLANQSASNSFIDGDWIESPYISDEGIRYLTTGNIGDGRFKEQGAGYITQKTFDDLNCKYAYPGDLVFSRLNSPYGRSCILPDFEDRYVLAVDNVILRTNENKQYICYCSQCTHYHHAVEDKASGTTMKRISRSNLGRIKIPLPPVAEQEAIAAWLDEKCGKIDKVIEGEKRRINLLDELKQSVITEAVTHGLNHDAPLKPSGVDWIGNIPEHWQMSIVGRHFDVILGKMLCTQPLDQTYTVEKYFCAGDVHFDGVNMSDLKEMWFSPSEKRRYIVKDRDLLIVEGGAGAGGCAIAHIKETDDYYIQNSILIVRSSINSSEYLKYLLESLVRAGYVDHVGNEATFAHFTKEKVCHIPFPVMSIAEQQAIVDYLDAKCGAIDADIAKTKRKIELLQEYKQSLITEAVTGKRKVI